MNRAVYIGFMLDVPDGATEEEVAGLLRERMQAEFAEGGDGALAVRLEYGDADIDG